MDESGPAERTRWSGNEASSLSSIRCRPRAVDALAQPERDPSPPAATVALEAPDGEVLGGRAARVHGELWGEAINGSGLEAVTPHLRFAYRRSRR